MTLQWGGGGGKIKYNRGQVAQNCDCVCRNKEKIVIMEGLSWSNK